ncbi:MAG: hypothetical protein ACFCA4_18740 [Cyanophyceae cyanobacterium]
MTPDVDLSQYTFGIHNTLRRLALTKQSDAFRSMLSKFGVRSMAELEDDALIRFHDILIEFCDRQSPEILSLIARADRLASAIDGERNPWQQGELQEWRSRHPQLTVENLTDLVTALENIASENSAEPAAA